MPKYKTPPVTKKTRAALKKLNKRKNVIVRNVGLLGGTDKGKNTKKKKK
jgi:hypothetical protein